MQRLFAQPRFRQLAFSDIRKIAMKHAVLRQIDQRTIQHMPSYFVLEAIRQAIGLQHVLQSGLNVVRENACDWRTIEFEACGHALGARIGVHDRAGGGNTQYRTGIFLDEHRELVSLGLT